MIFVFGSNLAGRHGAGAARYAYEKEGAVMGKGYGHFGNSFAIPTKNAKIETMPVIEINMFVELFLEYAKQNPQLEFKVTQIGCGLAGYTPADIAPMFIGGQDNVYYDTAWKDYLTDDSKFWGTM